MRLLEPRKVDDFKGKQMYTSGRNSPFHFVHYRMINWALNAKHAENLTVFLVKAPEPLNSTCPFTNSQREEMIKNCFDVDVYVIPPLTSLKNINKARQIIYNTLDHDAVYIGGEFQHIFAARLGGYKIANYKRGMFGGTSATEVRNLMYENNKKWKRVIPPPNYELLEEIIQTEQFRKAMQTEPPQGNPLRRAMKQLRWVH